MRQLQVSVTELTTITKQYNVIFLSHNNLKIFHFKGSAVDVTGTSIRGTFHQTTSQSHFIRYLLCLLISVICIFFCLPSNHQSVNLHMIILTFFIIHYFQRPLICFFLSSIKPLLVALVKNPFIRFSCHVHNFPCFSYFSIIFPALKFCASALLLHLKSDDFYLLQSLQLALHKMNEQAVKTT